MRSPKDFFRPLALGAPAPVREIPVRPSRMWPALCTPFTRGSLKKAKPAAMNAP